MPEEQHWEHSQSMVGDEKQQSKFSSHHHADVTSLLGTDHIFNDNPINSLHTNTVLSKTNV